MRHSHLQHRRPQPHRFWPDQDNPGCCRRCHLPDNAAQPRNAIHSGAAAAEQRAAERAAEATVDYIDPSRARRVREEVDRPVRE